MKFWKDSSHHALWEGYIADNDANNIYVFLKQKRSNEPEKKEQSHCLI